MILKPDNPFFKDLPGISCWWAACVANLSYWGFNQYIIQRALAAKKVREAQKGIVLAAFLKLLIPVLVVVPGHRGRHLSPNSGQARSSLSHADDPLAARLPGPWCSWPLSPG